LIRAAHARGLKIIIVSDTYLEESQLRRLLENCLPPDVMQMFLKIFCSCEHLQSKSTGLFKQVMDKLYESPRSLFHIGDNVQADYSSPSELKIQSLLLLHHDKKINNVLRMQALSGNLFDPNIRHVRSLGSPFRGVLASHQIEEDNPESLIGYASLGPILYAFGRFICDEVEQLKREGKNPKVLFLMRDAYLPSLVCTALTGHDIGKRVNISRFASFAASFRTKADVDQYLAANVMSFRFHDMCKQLLIPDKIAVKVCAEALKASHPLVGFIKSICRQEILDLIFKKSKAYRQRLKNHLQNAVGLEKGDTLVFVDLGYTGTSQVKLAPIFKEEMGIDVVGRYLIALSVPNWKTDRKGLMDASWCDERTMEALVAYIALLEQVCTANEKSVVDYEEDGSPIYSEVSASKGQHRKLDLIQSECLRFIHDAHQFFAAAQTQMPIEILRDNAMAELGRFLFLPTEAELKYLKSFKFDLNLGTKDMLNMFDEEKGLVGLRRRGLYFMEKNIKSMRTNYPAELRSAGLELSLTLMAHHRINFDIRVVDLSLRREKINIIAMSNGSATQTIVEAMPTHDGYFSLIIPVGKGSFQIGIQFGLHYQWVQLESAELIVAEALYGSMESENTIDAVENLTLDQMVERGGGLYECLSDTSLLIFVPKQLSVEHNQALRVVFRPIAVKNRS